MELLYSDDKIVVAIKPPGVPSTDEPGGMPDLIRTALGDPLAVVKTVHRLDQVVGGVMVLARTARAAADLSAQIQAHLFEKRYLAILHGRPVSPSGTWCDALLRDTVSHMTCVVPADTAGAQSAVLHYRVLAENAGLSRVSIQLETGRTHQIRVQSSSRGLPLVGDRRYGRSDESCGIALWSCQITFRHPKTDAVLTFSSQPPSIYPWTAV